MNMNQLVKRKVELNMDLETCLTVLPRPSLAEWSGLVFYKEELK